MSPTQSLSTLSWPRDRPPFGRGHAGGVTTPGFLTVDNALLIIRTTSLTGIAAIGMTFVTLSGAFFSLSVEQTATVCAISYALALSHGFGLAAALALTLAVAAGVGGLL